MQYFNLHISDRNDKSIVSEGSMVFSNTLFMCHIISFPAISFNAPVID